MRDRLIKLLCGVECDGEETLGNCPQRRDGKCRTVQKLEMCQIGAITDHLLANGVIVPPCKANDKIFVLGEDNGVFQIKECTVDYLGFEDVNSLEVRVMFECDENCEGCYFSSWSQMHCGEWTCSGEYGEGVIPIDNFGKTVFLEREDAERAMKGEHNAEIH